MEALSKSHFLMKSFTRNPLQNPLLFTSTNQKDKAQGQECFQSKEALETMADYTKGSESLAKVDPNPKAIWLKSPGKKPRPKSKEQSDSEPNNLVLFGFGKKNSENRLGSSFSCFGTANKNEKKTHNDFSEDDKKEKNAFQSFFLEGKSPNDFKSISINKGISRMKKTQGDFNLEKVGRNSKKLATETKWNQVSLRRREGNGCQMRPRPLSVFSKTFEMNSQFLLDETLTGLPSNLTSFERASQKNESLVVDFVDEPRKERAEWTREPLSCSKLSKTTLNTSVHLNKATQKRRMGKLGLEKKEKRGRRPEELSKESPKEKKPSFVILNKTKKSQNEQMRLSQFPHKRMTPQKAEGIPKIPENKTQKWPELKWSMGEASQTILLEAVATFRKKLESNELGNNPECQDHFLREYFDQRDAQVGLASPENNLIHLISLLSNGSPSPLSLPQQMPSGASLIQMDHTTEDCVDSLKHKLLHRLPFSDHEIQRSFQKLKDKISLVCKLKQFDQIDVPFCLKPSSDRLTQSEIEFIKRQFELKELSGHAFDILGVDSILKGLFFFRKFNQSVRMVFLSMSKLVSFKRGETVFQSGDSGESMFVILRGSVNVIVPRKKTKGNRVVACLYDGSSFGEYSILGLRSGVELGLYGVLEEGNSPLRKNSQKEESEARDERTKRSATVEVLESAEMLMLDRSAFKRVLMSLMQSDLDDKLHVLMFLPYFDVFSTH